MIVVSRLLELWPRFQALAFPPRYLPLGAVCYPAFFGGLVRQSRPVSRRLSHQAGIVERSVRGNRRGGWPIIVDVTRLLVYGSWLPRRALQPVAGAGFAGRRWVRCARSPG
jgi:hypothetical protein